MDWKTQLPDKVQPVVRLVAHGYTPEQIGDELCLATCTVRNYIQEARDIVGAQNAVQLGAWYFYRYGKVKRDFAPITKRIGKFFIVAMMLAGVTQIDAERAFRTARRGRRRDEVAVVDDTRDQRYTA